MAKQPPSYPSRPVHFEINASRCTLRVGDIVAPETEIGVDIATGKPVTAGCHGEVMSVRFDGGRHSLLVTVRSEPPRGSSHHEGASRVSGKTPK
jgi:hypothetical protein